MAALLKHRCQITWKLKTKDHANGVVVYSNVDSAGGNQRSQVGVVTVVDLVAEQSDTPKLLHFQERSVNANNINRK